MEYYRKSVSDSLQEQQSSAKGLTSAEVQRRLEKDGYNEIKGRDRDPLWKLFLENFKDPMVVVLLIAAAVQIFMGHVMESLIIFLVLILNAVISVIQTRKAESSLAALQQMSAPEAKVLRDGAPGLFRPASWSAVISLFWKPVILFLPTAGSSNPEALRLMKVC